MDVPSFRPPGADDGPRVHELIRHCPPLDVNSRYCTLLQCSHFTATSAVAEDRDGLIGWVGGYRVPAAPEVLFVWQIAVHPRARGRGLAVRLIEDVLRRPASRDVRVVEATVTEANVASTRMFASLAEALGAPLKTTPHFDAVRHLGGTQDTEHLLRIGPFAPRYAGAAEV